MADSTSVASICYTDTHRLKTINVMIKFEFMLLVDFVAITSVKAFLTVAQLDALLQKKQKLSIKMTDN